MKKMPITLLIMGSLILSRAVSAGDVFVIANNATTLTSEEIKDVYLGDKQLIGASKAMPIDNSALQKEFLEKVIKVDSAKYGAIWTKKGFRDGLNPPPLKSGDAEVIAVVKATAGAVGYVASVPAGVKVIQKY